MRHSKEDERILNLNSLIITQLAVKLGLPFIDKIEPGGVSFSSINLLDYIYAVLYSPAYRNEYKEFLKIDFPRIPYPKDADNFWKLVKLGGNKPDRKE